MPCPGRKSIGANFSPSQRGDYVSDVPVRIWRWAQICELATKLANKQIASHASQMKCDCDGCKWSNELRDLLYEEMNGERWDLPRGWET